MNPRYKDKRRIQLEPLMKELEVEGWLLKTANTSTLTYAEIGGRGLAILKVQADEIYDDIQKLQEEICHLTGAPSCDI